MAVDVEYVAQRYRLANGVRQAIASFHATLRLRGSFAYGDFHLDRHSGSSCSDIDTVGSDLPPAELGSYSDRLSQVVYSYVGIRLRVSIHPAERFMALSPQDARFLAIAEYLRHSPTCGDDALPVLRAKVSLLVVRENQAERYVETARRIGTRPARLALRTKLGYDRNFSVDGAAALLSDATTEGDLFLRRCILNGPTHAFVEEYVACLRRRTGVHPWLRQYLAGGVFAQWH
jgi:hypothetical protein